jgi:hypothetical protein
MALGTGQLADLYRRLSPAGRRFHPRGGLPFFCAYRPGDAVPIDPRQSRNGIDIQPRPFTGFITSFNRKNGVAYAHDDLGRRDGGDSALPAGNLNRRYLRTAIQPAEIMRMIAHRSDRRSRLLFLRL